MRDLHRDVVGQFGPTASSATTLAGSRTFDPWGKVTAQAGAGADVGYQGSWTDASTSVVKLLLARGAGLTM